MTTLEPVRPPESFSEPVVIYTTRWCGYCVAALRLLRQRNISFAHVPVDGDRSARDFLIQRTHRTTVPQIFIHGRSIGGYDELHELDRVGELLPMIATGAGE